MQGAILDVDVTIVGDELDVDHLAGATTLYVVGTDDFDPAGGTVEVAGIPYLYTVVNTTAQTLTLTTGLLGDAEASTRVNVSPIRQEKWAKVELQNDDDVVLALVPHALWDRIAEGVRDPENQELVIIEQQEGDWLVQDVIASTPVITTAYTDLTKDPVIGDLISDVLDTSTQVDNNTVSLENAIETAYSANLLASTADGRVSMSDYDPGPGDVAYYATDKDGKLIKGSSVGIISRQLTSGTATLVYEGITAPDLDPGEYIAVQGVGVPFDGQWLLVSNTPGDVVTQVGDTVTGGTLTYTILNQANVALGWAAAGTKAYASILLSRTQGSIWFTRTRSRVNLVTNPSFEVNTTHWTSSQASLLRELSSTVISGSYTLKVTNSGVAGAHYAEWDQGGGASRLVAAPGDTLTASVFAAAVGSIVNGAVLRLYFWTSGGGLAGSYDSPVVNLAVDDYQRLSVTATAPASTASVTMRLVTPSGTESAVYRLDGALLEAGDELGRYFDGRSYDAVWGTPQTPGTADLAVSSLIGGKIVKAWELDGNSWIPKVFTGFVLADIDASAVTTGTMDGERIADFTLQNDKLIGVPFVASEALVAGNLINIHVVGGLFRGRKASASLKYPADGFVLTDVASGAIGMYFSSGYNQFVSGLTPGPVWLSTTAGGVTRTAPTAVGQMLQPVGNAGGATVMSFTRGTPLTRT